MDQYSGPPKIKTGHIIYSRCLLITGKALQRPMKAASNMLCLQGETWYKFFNPLSRAHLKDLGPNIHLIYTSVNLETFHLN